ncbi:MAG: hypothetical protein M3141_01020 [Actinomycetota bacterium]|nr:hypothetical protein [Actinomycetota bacterium]
MSVRRLAAALALAALAVMATTALASSRPTGSAAATQRCFNFTVVQPDPQARFAAGVYRRLNFSPGNTLSCNTTYHLLRSYLYDPRSLRGWTVGPLVGPLRNTTGRRFVRNGTRGQVGFDVYRNTPPPTPSAIVRNVSLQAGTTRTYTTRIPTRTPDVGQTVQLVNAAGAQMLQSGFYLSGGYTVYFARVQTPNLVGYQGQAQFRITTQQT